MFDKMYEIKWSTSKSFGLSYDTSLISSNSGDNARNGKFLLEEKSDG